MAENHAGQEVLLLQELRKSYNVGKPTEVEVLHGLNLRLQRHDFAALVGASGSGKSTLLNVIGLLDKPTAGEIFLLGEPTRNMDDARRTKLRGSAIGFVFQFHHLIQAFSVLENVLMPLMVASGKPAREQLERARDLLSQVGLAVPCCWSRMTLACPSSATAQSRSWMEPLQTIRDMASVNRWLPIHL